MRFLACRSPLQVDYSKMQNFDEKTWGIDLIPEAGKFFKTVVKLSPQQLKDAGGLEPSKRDEINFFKDGAGAYQPFDVPAASVLKKSLGVSKVCQFIFAFPAADDADSAVSPALKTLGWLPEAGKTSFMYIFKAPVNALYGSVGAKIASGSEIGFGQLVPFSSVVAAYEIDSKGKVVKTFDANAIAALKA